MVAAPLHDTFSISRFLSDRKKPMRNRENIQGIPSACSKHRPMLNERPTRSPVA